MTIRRRVILWLVVLGGLSVGSLSATRIATPTGIFHYHPAATVYGSEAVWCNPSMLGWFDAVEYQLMAQHDDGSFTRSWGTVVANKGLSTAYRRLYNPNERNYQEHIFASGFPLGRSLCVGGAYRYYKEGPTGYHKRHFWDMSVSGRPGGPFSWAAVFSNLNRGRLDGDRTETQQRYSLAYRPLPGKLTVAVDAFLSTRQSFKDAHYSYHAELVPVPGLFVEGQIDSDGAFQLGFRVNLRKYFTGGQSDFTRAGDHTRSIVYMGASSQRQASIIPPRKRRLRLAVSGRPEENPVRPVIGRQKTPFWSVLLNIYRAADDHSIGEMVIGLNSLSLGFGQAQELRDALSYFRRQGKEVICHISRPNNIGYYVASVANLILIPPVSQLNLIGLRAELTFYAGTMEKLGIKADLVRFGKYKQAAEAYTHKTASEEGCEATNRLLDDLYDQFVIGIAEGRGLSPDSVKSMIDLGPFTSEEALSLGLVDGLSYRDKMHDDILRSMTEISFRRYQTDTLLNDGWPRLPVLAIVVAEGEVTDSRRSSSPFNSGRRVTPGTMAAALESVQCQPDVKGVVWRINSPGGLAMAGERIYHSVDELSRHKSLVVSMANVTASAGYYFSTPGRRLFASPGSVTGSIGIYGGKADLSGLHKKIGLGKEMYTRGKFAGMLSNIRPFTDEERARYRDQLGAFYNHFVRLVAESRGLSIDSTDALSQGRVWTGREALEIGLVDELGGLRRALDYTANALGLTDYRVEVYPQRRSWFAFPGLSLFTSMAKLFDGEADPVEAVSDMLFPVGEGIILARMPYDIEFE